jgi:hypothetical protein
MYGVISKDDAARNRCPIDRCIEIEPPPLETSVVCKMLCMVTALLAEILQRPYDLSGYHCRYHCYCLDYSV